MSPLLCRVGPIIAFSKAQTIFSKLLALCLLATAMELVGVAADDVPLPDDETNVSVSTKKLGGCETTEFSLFSLIFKGIRTGRLVSAFDGVLGIVGVASPEPGNSSKVNLGVWMVFVADDFLTPKSMFM